MLNSGLFESAGHPRAAVPTCAVPYYRDFVSPTSQPASVGRSGVKKHDVSLFDRSGRRLMLTEAGQVLLNEAERILRDVDLTIRRVESRRPTGQASLVACTANAYDFWMPEIFARVGAAKAVDVDLVRGTVDEVAAWVAAFSILALLIPGAEALIYRDASQIQLDKGLPLLLMSVYGAAVLYRSWSGGRVLVGLALVAGLAGSIVLI